MKRTVDMSPTERRDHMHGPAFEAWLKEVLVQYPELAEMSREVLQVLFMLIEDSDDSEMVSGELI